MLFSFFPLLIVRLFCSSKLHTVTIHASASSRDPSSPSIINIFYFLSPILLLECHFQILLPLHLLTFPRCRCLLKLWNYKASFRVISGSDGDRLPAPASSAPSSSSLVAPPRRSGVLEGLVGILKPNIVAETLKEK